MCGNRTFTMIKPNSVRSNHQFLILDKVVLSGFKIVAMKLVWLTLDEAQKFYIVHLGKGFYDELCTFMSSGPIIAAILEKDNAVKEYRDLVGDTDPAKAEEGTIRKLFGSSKGENSVHASDSNENAEIEANFFFCSNEILNF